MASNPLAPSVRPRARLVNLSGYKIKLRTEPSEEEAEPWINPMEGLRQVIREKNAECETLRREIYSLREKIARTVRPLVPPVKKQRGDTI